MKTRSHKRESITGVRSPRTVSPTAAHRKNEGHQHEVLQDDPSTPTRSVLGTLSPNLPSGNPGEYRLQSLADILRPHTVTSPNGIDRLWEVKDTVKRKRNDTQDSHDESNSQVQPLRSGSLSRSLHSETPHHEENIVSSTLTLRLPHAVIAQPEMLTMRREANQIQKQFYTQKQHEIEDDRKLAQNIVDTAIKQQEAVHKRRRVLETEQEELSDRLMKNKAEDSEANEELNECIKAQKRGESEIRNKDMIISCIKNMVARLDS